MYKVAVAACKGSGVKVIAGAGSNATHEACDLANMHKMLEQMEYYQSLHTTINQLKRDYTNTIKQLFHVEIPFMLYNVPGRTGVDLSAQTAIRLFDDVKIFMQ